MAEAAHIAVRIKAHTKIGYGEDLLVCGSAPALGSWNLADAALMQCKGDLWTLTTELPCGVRVELKLVQRPQGRQVVWYGTGPGGNGNLMLETSLGRAGAMPSHFVNLEGTAPGCDFSSAALDAVLGFLHILLLEQRHLMS
eukprot:s1297_g19.t1